MMSNVINFSHKPRHRQASGKQPDSSSNNLEQGPATSATSTTGRGNTPPHSPTTSHMEVTVKLTLEISDENQ